MDNPKTTTPRPGLRLIDCTKATTGSKASQRVRGKVQPRVPSPPTKDQQLLFEAFDRMHQASKLRLEQLKAKRLTDCTDSDLLWMLAVELGERGLSLRRPGDIVAELRGRVDGF
jgi:hypothetical protein